jgi:Family of unknown function (DUF6288)/HEAT repeats
MPDRLASLTRLPIAAVFIFLFAVSLSAQKKPAPPAPDFTRGETIPEGWTHDWNLGPTGVRGWMHSFKHSTADARQIYVTEVAPKSPAAGVLRPGDVILGLGAANFESDPRQALGRAIGVAESEQGGGKLLLRRWRKGETKTVALKLRVLGSYADTAPYQCSKSEAIVDAGCRSIAESLIEKPNAGHAIVRAQKALALLASGDKKHRKVLRDQMKRLAKFEDRVGYHAWSYCFVNIALAEYVLATGDRGEIKKGLKRITRLIVEGQSVVGSWGHRFVDPRTGVLRGYGMMNAPGIPLAYSLALAKRAGIRVPGLDQAVERSKLLLRFYVGKGSIPYGDHAPWIQTHCDNGKNEAAAVLFDLEGDREATTYFSRMALASHGPEREEGHTGNFLNLTWALLGVARSGPDASGAWLEEFGWYYDLARRWDGSFRHQGPPAQKPDSYRGWDSTASFVLSYAQARRKIFLTGKQGSSAPAIERADAQAIVLDGRGWSAKDPRASVRGLKTDDLIARLSSWSPVLRERAANELGQRKVKVVPRLIALLDDTRMETRYGACRALHFQKARGAAAVPRLRELLQSEDLWLRVRTCEALSGIGKPARAAVPDLLARVSVGASKSDPRGMEQRYMMYALFNRRGGLLGRSLEGIDQVALGKAVRAGLTNEDGRARGMLSSVYRNLSLEEIRPLFPAIIAAVRELAPSGIMFGNGIRTAGLQLLARHHVAEGLDLAVYYARHQKAHGSKRRIGGVMKCILAYGAHAKRVLPELRELAKFFAAGEGQKPNKNSRLKAEAVETAIRKIEGLTEKPVLIQVGEEAQ